MTARREAFVCINCPACDRKKESPFSQMILRIKRLIPGDVLGGKDN
ncbi:MAG: hypothetical protein UY21_C0029G0005 [Microgenomates group bacterium GW2011_GWA1_48_10]|nr:MAG: hypothetical protein UY21_C0029G0005 [Microgenomates group bacterium GW2011_GWA1_48_10]